MTILEQICPKWNSTSNPHIGRQAALALEQVMAAAPDQLSGCVPPHVPAPEAWAVWFQDVSKRNAAASQRRIPTHAVASQRTWRPNEATELTSHPTIVRES